MPPKAKLERALRSTVADLYSQDRFEELTVKSIRGLVEKQLKLEKNFFKLDDEWNAKSKEVITSEVAKLEEKAASAEESEEEAPKPTPKKQSATKKRKSDLSDTISKPAKKAVPKKKKGKAEEDDDDASADTKARANTAKKRRANATSSTPKKRMKKESSAELSSAPEDEADDIDAKSDDAVENGKASDDSEPLSDVEDAPKAKYTGKISRKKTSTPEPSDSAKGDMAVQTPDRYNKFKTPPPERSPAPKQTPAADDQSDSDMSSLIDDGPPRRKKAGEAGTSKTSSKGKKSPQKKRKSGGGAGAPEDDPKTAEIKRLQSWLTKCGIRKMWWKELQPYESQREKIAHLREMLQEAGMGTRFSNERAREIREKREMLEDLQAVTEGDRRWGTHGEEGGLGEAEEEEEVGVGARKRKGRLAKRDGTSLRTETEKTEDKPDNDEDEEEVPSGGRKLARGLKALAFFDDDEESD